MTDTLQIRRPDDWHVHLRDGDMLRAVLPATARSFARGVVMPNLDPPVTSTDQAARYRERILAALPAEHDFLPLMTCYLTDATDADDVRHGFETGVFTAAKLYPAGATFQSDRGVTALDRITGVLEVMQAIGMPLCVHGEVTDPDVDVFDREAVFIDRVLVPLQARLPALKVVFEHVTTAEAVDYVRAATANTAATITPHHLLINRNAMFERGLRPHHYCLPVAKRERHRQALRQAATSGDTRFFAGTDSAPHTIAAKRGDCGCAGIYNAPTALACYARVFEEEGALSRLETFVSFNGARFYELPPNDATVTLIRSEAALGPGRERLADGGEIMVFAPPGGLNWHLA